MKNRTSQHFIHQTWLVTALLLCLQAVAPAHGFTNQAEKAESKVKQLEPGQSVEREMAAGESHIYQLTLQTGQFLRVLADQKGINVMLVLLAPDGKQADEIDFLGGAAGTGQESLSYEAVTGGDYRLIVRAIGSATPSGAYQMRVEIRATATEQDRCRVVAERISYEAVQLIRQ